MYAYNSSKKGAKEQMCFYLQLCKKHDLGPLATTLLNWFKIVLSLNYGLTINQLHQI